MALIYVTVLFPGGHLASDAAEGFAGDTEIGGNHVLGHPLHAVGIALQEFCVLLFRRFA
jgi:hypothetical protein